MVMEKYQGQGFWPEDQILQQMIIPSDYGQIICSQIVTRKIDSD